MSQVATSKSIAQLEGTEWPPPPTDPSRMMLRCHELRQKPLSEMDVSDLRFVVGQDMGLRFTVPLALDVLEKDLLVEAEHYKGDLLEVVLSANRDVYRQQPELKFRVEKLLVLLPAALDRLDHIDFDTASEALEEAVQVFRR